MAALKENIDEYYFKIFCKFAELKIILRFMKIMLFKKKKEKNSTIVKLQLFN